MKYTYDEEGVAFYFFLLAILSVYILVAGYYWVVSPLRAGKPAKASSSSTSTSTSSPTASVMQIVENAAEAVECHCDGCKWKESRKETLAPLISVARPASGVSRWKKGSVMLAVVLFAITLRAVWNAQISYTPYNPFEVLQISEVNVAP